MKKETVRLCKGPGRADCNVNIGHLHAKKPAVGIIRQPIPSADERDKQKAPCLAGGIKKGYYLRNGVNLAVQTLRLLLG